MIELSIVITIISASQPRRPKICHSYSGMAGATWGVPVYIHRQIHRSGKFTVNHKGNYTPYMHKYCAMCLIFVQH